MCVLGGSEEAASILLVTTSHWMTYTHLVFQPAGWQRALRNKHTHTHTRRRGPIHTGGDRRNLFLRQGSTRSTWLRVASRVYLSELVKETHRPGDREYLVYSTCDHETSTSSLEFERTAYSVCKFRMSRPDHWLAVRAVHPTRFVNFPFVSTTFFFLLNDNMKLWGQ